MEDRTPRDPHRFKNVSTTSSADQQGSPTTPPCHAADLPTPPTSHNDFRRPPNPVASSSLTLLNDDDVLPGASPTTVMSDNIAPRRAAGRLSGGGSSINGGEELSSPSRRHASGSWSDRTPNERRQVLQEAERVGSCTKARSPSQIASRTPSPILGSSFIGGLSAHSHASPSSSQRIMREADDLVGADNIGRLSVPALGLGLGPSKEDVELLIYGSAAEEDLGTNSSQPEEDGADVQQMLQSLAKMGLDDPEASGNQREKELAGMVKMLARRCNNLVASRDRMQVELQTNRLAAISIISSLKTANAHALITERSVRDRLEAEFEGWKAQAKMLSTLLSRAEARGYDERRVVSAADRSKNLAAAWPSTSRVPAAKSEESVNKLGTADSLAENGSIFSAPGSGVAPQLDGAFEPSTPSRGSPNLRLAEPPTPAGEESRGRNRKTELLALAADSEARFEGITGLGISSTGGPETDPEESPMSAIVRERNKLVTDKRYLKSRVRDAEAQIHRLEIELKSLRPYLVAGGVKLNKVDSARPHSAGLEAPNSQLTGTDAGSGVVTAPTTPSRSGSRKDKSRRKRQVTMGDAETEHLMLAAHRLREIRKEQAASATAASANAPSSSSLTASVLAPPAGVIPGIAHTSPIKRQASEGPMLLDGGNSVLGSPRTPPSRLGERPPKTPKSNASVPSTPRMLSKSRQADRPEALQAREETNEAWNSQHRLFDSSVSASSFTGIDELLQAAETLNPRAAAASSPMIRSVPAPQRSAGHDAPPFYSREAARAYPHQNLPARDSDYDPYSRPVHQLASSPIWLAYESPKRRRVSSAAIEAEPFGSPFAGDRQPRGRTSTEGADPYSQAIARGYADYAQSGTWSAAASQGLTALDLLADQAAASQNPSQGSDRSGDYDGVSPIGSLSSEDEAMAVDGDSTFNDKRGKNSRSSSYRSGKSPQRGGSQKGGSAAPSGANGQSQGTPKSSDSRTFGGNQNPEKRLPYVRWTSEEDTKLRAAIKEHGQRWELISRAVGTRSYHQCRQRYLLMRRKEAAAKAQAEAEETINTNSASASDHQSQEEGDDGRTPPASASVSHRKSTGRRGQGSSRGGLSTNDEHYEEDELSDDGSDGGKHATPLHKLSIGAPAPGGSNLYDPYSPTARHGPLSASSHTLTHSRSLSHPHPLSPVQQAPPISPYTHQKATPTAHRGYYPPPSPLSQPSRQLPPLTEPGNYGPNSPLHHHRSFPDSHRGPPPPSSGGPELSSPTTPSSSTAGRRMGATLYS